MRSIREYIKASLSDSSHILYTNTHSVPRGVVDFTFIRAPVKRIADVLSKGFPSGEHVYDLTPRWRVELRRVPFFSGLQCFVWTTSLGCAIGGYNLSFRYGAPNPTNPTNPTNPGFWDIL
jgi:hypothetical protein